MAMSVRVAWLAIGLIPMGCAPRYDHSRFPPEYRTCTLQIAVPNMACPDRCPKVVWQALKTVHGVGDVQASYEQRTVIVRAGWPACSHDGMEDMLVALEARGYQGVFVRQ